MWKNTFEKKKYGPEACTLNLNTDIMLKFCINMNITIYYELYLYCISV